MTDQITRRVLIGGIGYRDLRDYSVGVVATDHLGLRDWPPGVEVDDLSFNPVAVSQRLEDVSAANPIDCLIVVAAVARARRPGTVTAYRWDGVLPDAEAIQSAVAEAVTGVIALDNTLVVVRQFGGLPEMVIVVEIEPAIEEFGEAFSDDVQASFDGLCDLVAELATQPVAAARLDCLPLGGTSVTGTRTE